MYKHTSLLIVGRRSSAHRSTAPRIGSPPAPDRDAARVTGLKIAPKAQQNSHTSPAVRLHLAAAASHAQAEWPKRHATPRPLQPRRAGRKSSFYSPSLFKCHRGPRRDRTPTPLPIPRPPPPMPAKRSSAAASVVALPAGRRARARLCLRLAAPLSFLLLLAALLRTQPLAAPPAALPPSAGPGKVAFLFLVRAGVPLDFLWDAFFRNGDEGRFSVYVHSAPGFELDRTTTGSPYFYGRQLAKSVKVAWGEPTMVEAERMLFAAALEDPTNQRFVLLSDSCVPLYNFSYIYTYLMASPKSFVDSFIDKAGKRYNPNMSPAIPKDKWRKGSQWAMLIRKHAEVVVGDKHVFQVFRKHCKMVVTKTLLGRKANARRLGFELRRKQIMKGAAQKEHDCIPDEHYVQTVFSIKGLEHELERRTLTYTSWNQSSSDPKDKNTWHPMTFEYDTSSPEHVNAIKSIDHVNYQMEYRTEWCQCNGTSVPCFLFARKFSYSAAMHLLEEGALGPLKSAQLLVHF